MQLSKIKDRQGRLKNALDFLLKNTYHKFMVTKEMTYLQNLSIKKHVPEYLMLQVACYGLALDGEVRSASMVDSDTIRIWFLDNKTKRLTCVLKPYIKNDKVDTYGLEPFLNRKIIDVPKSKNEQMFEEIK
jgi:hypothetical protein